MPTVYIAKWHFTDDTDTSDHQIARPRTTKADAQADIHLFCKRVEKGNEPYLLETFGEVHVDKDNTGSMVLRDAATKTPKAEFQIQIVGI